MLWPLEKVHQTLLTVFARIILFELDFGTWYNWKGICWLWLNSSNTSELLWIHWFIHLRVFKTLYSLVSHSVSLWVHIVVKNRQVEGLSHLNLHSTVMHTSIILVWCEARRHNGISQWAIDSDNTSWLVNRFHYWSKERAAVTVILFEPIAQALLRHLFPIIDGPAHLFLI